MQSSPTLPYESYCQKLTQEPLSLTESEEDLVDRIGDFLESIGVGVLDNGDWYLVSKFY